MQKSSRETLIRYAIYVIELILVYALERAVNARFGFGGLYFFITIPAFVSVALFERENSGMIFGILSGVLVDYGHGKGIGAVAIVLCVFGYAIGLISNYILCASVFVGMFVSVFLITAVEGIKVLCAVKDFNLWVEFLGGCFWKSLLVSVPIFIVTFYLNRVISYKFGGKEEIFN